MRVIAHYWLKYALPIVILLLFLHSAVPTLALTPTSSPTFTPSPTATLETPAATATSTATPTVTISPMPSETPTACGDIEIAAGDVYEPEGLIAALNFANERGSTGAVICLAPDSIYTLTDVDNATDGNNGLPAITGRITIEGRGATIARSDSAESTFRIFHVGDGAQLTLNNITLTNGSAQDTMEVTTFDDDGGAIYAEGATLLLNDVTLESNTAASGGGALYIGQSSNANIRASSAVNNTALSFGGAAYVSASTVSVQNSVISGNRSVFGGAIYNFNSPITIDQTLISQNIAQTFGSEEAGWGGALIGSGSAGYTITGSRITENSSDAGGAIFIAANSTILISQTAITNNSDAGIPVGFSSGAALTLENNVTSRLENTTVANNQGFHAGAIVIGSFLGGGSRLDLIHSTVVNNRSETETGGILTTGPAGVLVNLRGVIIANNTVVDVPHDVSGTFTSLDYNLIENPDSNAVFIGTATHNIILGLDPQLGPLTTDPVTGQVYYPLLPEVAGVRGDSPALDVIPHDICDDPLTIGEDTLPAITTDQLGTVRFQGSGCDLGAIESSFVRNDSREDALDISDEIEALLTGERSDFTTQANTFGSATTPLVDECIGGATPRNHIRFRTPTNASGSTSNTDRLEVNTVGSNFDTVLAIYEEGETPADSSLIVCNDNARIPSDDALLIETLDYRYVGTSIKTEPTNASKGVFTLKPDTEYVAEVGGVNGATGSLVVNFRLAETKADNSANDCNFVESNGLWFAYRAGEFGTPLQLDTIDSTYDTTMTVYRRPVGTNRRLRPVACDADSGLNNSSLLRPLALETGFDYFVYINAEGNVTQSDTLDFDVARILSLEHFTLINSASNQPVVEYDPMPQEAVVDLAQYPSLNIEVIGSNPNIASVRFMLSGAQILEKVENVRPFSVFGNVDGGYAAWQPTPGVYTLSAVPYPLPDGLGVAGQPLTITFEVVDTRPGMAVVNFTLINSDTDQPVPGYDPIPEGAVLNISELPARINIRANTNSVVGSVSFRFNNRIAYSQIQNAVPYALFNDNNGDYAGWRPRAGAYTLIGTPYEFTGRRGTAGRSATLNFSIVADVARRAELTALTATTSLNSAGVTMTFRWTTAEAASWYNIALVDAQNAVVLDTWVEAAMLCAQNTCTFTPSPLPDSLTNGVYTWWARSWADDELTAWQVMGTTVLDMPRPALPTSFSSRVEGEQIVLTWSHDPYATWYQLGVIDLGTGAVFQQWYAVRDLTCAEGVCSLTLPTNDAAGMYQWYIQPWGPGGDYTQLGAASWAGGELITLSATR